MRSEAGMKETSEFVASARVAIDPADAYAEALSRFRDLEGDPYSSARLSMGQILMAAEQATGIPASELRGRSRIASVCTVRHEAMLIGHEYGLSLGQIGAALGGRDHSTVSNGIRRAKMHRARTAFKASS